MNDFLEVFLLQMNASLELPYQAYIGFLDEKSGISVYSLPGGKAIEGYMNGQKLMRLPFEIAIQSSEQEIAITSLWKISDFLKDNTVPFVSRNGSFQFEQISTEDEPFNGGMTEHQSFIYILRFYAEIIVGE